MDSAESAKRDHEIAALKEKGVEQMKREWTEQLISSGGSQRERMRPALTQMINDWSAWQPLHKEVRLFYAREAWQQLKERGTVSVPTLFLRGESDLKGKTFSPREAKHLSNSRIVVLPDCGHMMNMERPKDFNRSILEFLSSCPVQ
jgi:pimeloyl-ACP methyl ester carboxylesterase